ncbi:aminotransferase class V-fold PLP-dependent enzyme [Candidatus Poribacteria bacterium]|nr:aminotransferase class V-fold PLP-dependent enzyme [Candidatus Poribacteria bacterium]
MDVYDDLGIRKVINGLATVTTLGGSIIPPEVMGAMAEAARYFVDVDELQHKIGERIAQWTHNEAAYICCGAAAGIAVATAACIAGTDPAKSSRLPHTEGMKNQVIVHKHGRVGFDYSIKQAGGVLVEIGDETGTTVEDMEKAINEKTAAIFYFYRPHVMELQLPLDKGIQVAKKYDIPVVVDAAAQIPPVENLWWYTQQGADLAIFSGGKGLRGPQSSGLIVGRKDLIDACAFNSCPRISIGRPMKVGKEEMVGLMAAVKRYLNLDHKKLMQTYEDQVQYIRDAFKDMEHVSTKRNFPSEAGQPMPRAELIFDEEKLGKTRNDILRELREGEPSIALAGAGNNGIYVNPQTLEPGQEEIIVRRIKEIIQEITS